MDNLSVCVCVCVCPRTGIRRILRLYGNACQYKAAQLMLDSSRQTVSFCTSSATNCGASATDGSSHFYIKSIKILLNRFTTIIAHIGDIDE